METNDLKREIFFNRLIDFKHILNEYNNPDSPYYMQNNLLGDTFYNLFSGLSFDYSDIYLHNPDLLLNKNAVLSNMYIRYVLKSNISFEILRVYMSSLLKYKHNLLGKLKEVYPAKHDKIEDIGFHIKITENHIRKYHTCFDFRMLSPNEITTAEAIINNTYLYDIKLVKEQIPYEPVKWKSVIKLKCHTDLIIDEITDTFKEFITFMFRTLNMYNVNYKNDKSYKRYNEMFIDYEDGDIILRYEAYINENRNDIKEILTFAESNILPSFNPKSNTGFFTYCPYLVTFNDIIKRTYKKTISGIIARSNMINYNNNLNKELLKLFIYNHYLCDETERIYDINDSKLNSLEIDKVYGEQQ